MTANARARRYSLLHPTYLERRIKELRGTWRLRVALCLVDVDDNTQLLVELNKLCVDTEMTLVLAWSELEAARYLETFKVYEHKGAASIKERVDADYLARLNDCLTSIRSVNKTDVVTLSSAFPSLAALMQASHEELSQCAGIGEKKVRRLHDAFHEPFCLAASEARRLRQRAATPTSDAGPSVASVAPAPADTRADTGPTEADEEAIADELGVWDHPDEGSDAG